MSQSSPCLLGLRSCPWLSLHTCVSMQLLPCALAAAGTGAGLCGLRDRQSSLQFTSSGIRLPCQEGCFCLRLPKDTTGWRVTPSEPKTNIHLNNEINKWLWNVLSVILEYVVTSHSLIFFCIPVIYGALAHTHVISWGTGLQSYGRRNRRKKGMF